MNFKGKTVIVTGSTRGIGKEIAKRFLELEANVVISGTSEKVFDTQQELKKISPNVEAVFGDIKLEDTAKKLVAKALESFGSIDILVNNAGITRDKFMLKMKEEDWDDVLDINLKGSFWCTKAVAKAMLKKRAGCIINITSVVGVMGNSSQVNYASSKAGMIGMTKSTAKELASRGIRCNAVAPGFIMTDMSDQIPDSVKEQYQNSIPLKRYGKPSEVADVVLFLASDYASYITGQILHVDGGLVI